MPDPVERRLAAIMFTDIVGYTALMAESEEKGLRVRERHRALVRPLVERYHGESIEARGDESLSTFPTALDAVNCALAIEAAARDDAELKLHVGIHLGTTRLRLRPSVRDIVHLLSQLDIQRGHAPRIVGREVDDHPVPDVEPLGMVLQRLRDQCDARHEAERLVEVPESKLAMQLVVLD